MADPHSPSRRSVGGGAPGAAASRARAGPARPEPEIPALLESAPEAILVVDEDGRVVLVNRRAEALFGYPRGDLVGQPVEMLLPDALRDAHRRHRAAYFAEPRSRSMGQGLDLSARRRDGTELPVEVSLGFSRTEAGLRAIAFVTDITERKRIEQALRRSEARGRILLEASPEGILIVDRAGHITSANTRAAALFGYGPDELVGRPIETLVPERRRTDHRRHRAGYFDAPSVRAMGRGLDLVACRKDGSEFPVEVGLTHIETEEGPQAVAFVTDISERLAVERATRQAERLAALGTLAAGVVHEMNNPLGIMTSRIELMLLDAETHGLPAAVVDDLRVLHRNAERIARIARSLLSFSRVSPEERHPVDLNRVVTETLQLVARQLGTEGVEIVTALGAGLPAVLGHGNALTQVLLNLLTNARDAMRGPGTIRIETEQLPGRPDDVVLRVADSGRGIPADVLPRIFDPFFTTKPSGTGLGLSVTYGIVHDHNGTITVDSAPGRGTTFTLTFPVAPPF